MIHFIGAGPGAADLITVRGARLLGGADVIIYAGSLVNPALLDYKKEDCAVYDSAGMTLEERRALLRLAVRECTWDGQTLHFYSPFAPPEDVALSVEAHSRL